MFCPAFVFLSISLSVSYITFWLVTSSLAEVTSRNYINTTIFLSRVNSVDFFFAVKEVNPIH